MGKKTELKKIEISCKGSGFADFEEIENLQGEIKSLSEANLEKLKKSILKYGFSAPIFIWENAGKKWSLDGIQRIKALHSLKDDGYKIPALPIVEIFAKTKKEALEKLYRITSQYGKLSKSDISSQIQNFKLNIDEISIWFDPVNIGQSYERKEIELKPYKNIHVLLSFHPDRMPDVIRHLEKIKNIDGVEYEQSSN
jgi:hypothetical protein